MSGDKKIDDNMLAIMAFEFSEGTSAVCKRAITGITLVKDIVVLSIAYFGSYLFYKVTGFNPVLFTVMLVPGLWWVDLLSIPFIDIGRKSSIENSVRYEYSFVEEYIEKSLEKYKGVVVQNVIDTGEVFQGKHEVFLKMFYKGYIKVLLSDDVYTELVSAFNSKYCGRMYVANWKWHDGVKIIE